MISSTQDNQLDSEDKREEHEKRHIWQMRLF